MNYTKFISLLLIINVVLIITTIWIVWRINALSSDISQIKQQEINQNQKVITSNQTYPSLTTDIPTQKNMVIVINQDGFSPKGIQANINQKIELSITNEDKVAHSFNIDELNIKSGPIAPSQTISITIDNLPDESAAYQYYSDIDNDKQNEKLKGILMILK